MPDTENGEENTEPTTYVNTVHMINVDQSRQSPEMTHSSVPRHSLPASVNLSRFDPGTHRVPPQNFSLVDNISSRIEGLRPLVERVRSYPRLSSFFNIHRHRLEASAPTNANDSFTINIEEGSASNAIIAARTPHEDRHCQLHNRRSTETSAGNETMGGSSSETPNNDNDVLNEETSAPDVPVETSTAENAAGAAMTPTDGDGNNNNSEDSSVTENLSISENLTMSPEMRALLLILKRYVPYLLILTVKIVYDHIEGIMNLLFFLGTFTQVNQELKQEIGKQQNRSWLALLRILLHITGCFFFVTFVFGEQIFSFYAEPKTIMELLWIVTVMDFSLKLITVVIKVFVTCLPIRFLAIPKRGKYYLLIEAMSQVYRCCVPIKPWLFYLYTAYKGPEEIFGILLSIAYVISKTSDIISRISLFWTAASKMLQNMSLGVAPSKEQLVASGGVCAICHEEYSTPVRLSCKHIFCEACVATWLDRERSCPLCRAAITDDPIYRDGHTTNFIQLY